jgi:hypothetical protein
VSSCKVLLVEAYTNLIKLHIAPVYCTATAIAELAQLALSGVSGPHSSSFCEPEYIAQQRNLVRNEVALELFSCQRYTEVSLKVQYVCYWYCVLEEKLRCPQLMAACATGFDTCA